MISGEHFPVPLANAAPYLRQGAFPNQVENHPRSRNLTNADFCCLLEHCVEVVNRVNLYGKDANFIYVETVSTYEGGFFVYNSSYKAYILECNSPK